MSDTPQLPKLSLKKTGLVLLVFLLLMGGFVAYSARHQSRQERLAATGVAADAQDITTTQGDFIELHEWGVKAPSSPIWTLTYTIDDQTASFSSKQLTDLSPGCAGTGGQIIRYAKNDKLTDQPNQPSAADYFKNQPTANYAKVKNYYFVFRPSNSCSGPDPGTVMMVQAQTNAAVQKLVPALTPL